ARHVWTWGLKALTTMKSRRRVLAIASGGGHWIQLKRMMPAFEGHDVAFVTTLRSYQGEVDPARFYVVRDANLDRKLALLVLAIRMFFIVVRERPHLVISTGAAPGYFGLRFARWFGARTVWVDSIANAEKLSLSGRRVR